MFDAHTNAPDAHVVAYYKAAWDQGIDAGKARKAGRDDQGAMPEAERHGFPRGTSGYEAFITGYMVKVKPRPV